MPPKRPSMISERGLKVKRSVTKSIVTGRKPEVVVKKAPAGKPGTKKKDASKKVVAPKKAVKAPAGRPGTKKKEAGDRFKKPQATRKGTKKVEAGNRFKETLENSRRNMLKRAENDKIDVMNMLNRFPIRKSFPNTRSLNRFVRENPQYNDLFDKFKNLLKELFKKYKRIMFNTDRSESIYFDLQYYFYDKLDSKYYNDFLEKIKNDIMKFFDQKIDSIKRSIISAMAQTKFTGESFD